jgi:MarR family transcriptional regulator, organic hydroperoxide resistance regulator
MPRRSLPARPNVVFRLFIVENLVGELLDRELSGSGVAPRDFGILSGIGATSRITPSDLAELLGMPPTTLSTALKRLEASGDVTRSRNPDDGRSVLLELTAAGNERWQAAWPGLRRTLAAVDASLEMPVEQLQDALEAYERAARTALAT